MAFVGNCISAQQEMSLHNQLGLCTEKGQLEPYQAMQSYEAVQPQNNPFLVSDNLLTRSIM